MPPTFIPVALFVLCSFASPFVAMVLAVLAFRRATRAVASHALLAGGAGILLCLGGFSAIRLAVPDQSGIPSWITWATAGEVALLFLPSVSSPLKRLCGYESKKA